MKKSIKITAIFLVALSLASCKKWLDVAPKTEVKGDVLFSNQNGFRDALIGIYSLMTDSNSYGSALSMGTVDVLAQTYDNPRTIINHAYAKIAAYNYTDASVANRFANIWKQQYRCVVNANLILSYVDAKKYVFKPGIYNIVKGEALGLRAMLQFDLLRLYAPSVAMGPSEKAIPYADSYTNVPFPQSTVNEVLDKVLKDLTEAKALLKDVDPYGPNRAAIDLNSLDDILRLRENRLNYYAVTGLLARAYLYKGDKIQALANAREIITSDLFPMFNGTAATAADYLFPKEIVFGINVVGLRTKYSDRYFPSLITTGSALALTIDNTTVDGIYPPGVNTDFRRNWLDIGLVTNKRVVKYAFGGNVIPLIRKSEMFLIAAECEPNTATAVTYLNSLRAPRGLAPLDPPGTSAADLATEIGNEYRREFLAEGQLFFYYKRLNINKLPNTPAFTNNKAIYVVPIPDVEIEFGNIN